MTKDFEYFTPVYMYLEPVFYYKHVGFGDIYLNTRF